MGRRFVRALGLYRWHLNLRGIVLGEIGFRHEERRMWVQVGNVQEERTLHAARFDEIHADSGHGAVEVAIGRHGHFGHHVLHALRRLVHQLPAQAIALRQDALADVVLKLKAASAAAAAPVKVPDGAGLVTHVTQSFCQRYFIVRQRKPIAVNADRVRVAAGHHDAP